MKQPEEAAAETVAECLAAFDLEGEGCVVELELLQRLAQRDVIRGLAGVRAGEHHRLHRRVAVQRHFRRRAVQCESIAHPAIAHRLQARGDVTDFARLQPARRAHVGAEETDLERLNRQRRRHQPERLAGLHHPIHHAHVGDNPFVGIIMAVEDQGAQRLLALTVWRRHVLHDRFQQGRDVRSLLG